MKNEEYGDMRNRKQNESYDCPKLLSEGFPGLSAGRRNLGIAEV